MATMNWQVREHLHRFREPGDGRECRLDVLLSLALHMNQRGRTWVKRDTIAREIGVNEGQVSYALQWLFDKGAIYNVPYRYRVGAERDLEPRKYVLQLTGIIRFDENLVVPYLYLNNLEDEIANTLRELGDIGGEGLVAFLTQGSDSEHLPSSQSGDSQRWYSKHLDSQHKGSTGNALEGSTGSEGKDSSYRVPAGTRQVEAESYLPDYTGQSIQSAQLAQVSRQGERRTAGDDDPDDEEIVEDAPEYTPFEVWLLAACYNTKKLSAKQRKNFHITTPYLDDERKAIQSPTVNQAWDSDPAYQAFVQDVILLEIQGRRQLHPTGFHQTLNSKKTWERFYAWRKAHGDEYSPTSVYDEEDGRHVTMPDGVNVWVPNGKDIMEAVNEYLRSKNE